MITLIMVLSSDMGIALLSEEDRDDNEDTYELIIQVAWCMNWCRLYSEIGGYCSKNYASNLGSIYFQQQDEYAAMNTHAP